MIETIEKTVCSYCGNDLVGEELGNPHRDPNDDEMMCDECYQEHFEFECCRCLNYDSTEHQHDYLVVYEQVGDVKPGIYRVISYPYHGGALIGDSWLFANSLQRIRALEEPAEDDPYYPCGHLCLECQNTLKLPTQETKEITNN